MTQLTFLRRIGRPFAILVPVLCGVGSYFHARVGAAGAGAALGEAIYALLWLGLLHTPLYFTPSVAQRGWQAGAATLLLVLRPLIGVTLSTFMVLARPHIA